MIYLYQRLTFAIQTTKLELYKFCLMSLAVTIIKNRIGGCTNVYTLHCTFATDFSFKHFTLHNLELNQFYGWIIMMNYTFFFHSYYLYAETNCRRLFVVIHHAMYRNQFLISQKYRKSHICFSRIYTVLDIYLFIKWIECKDWKFSILFSITR